MNFERVESHGFVEILYPRSIYDLIDFGMRECVKQEGDEIFEIYRRDYKKCIVRSDPLCRPCRRS